jgi:hypothetical protein
VKTKQEEMYNKTGRNVQHVTNFLVGFNLLIYSELWREKRRKKK